MITSATSSITRILGGKQLMSKGFAPHLSAGRAIQREDLTVNLTVDLFLKFRYLRLPLYPCGFIR